MSYTVKYDDIIGFARFMGADTRERNDELWFRCCPKCGDTAKADDLWKFSINIDSGAFKCFRGSCGYQGHFVEMCREFNYPLISEEENRQAFRKLHVPAVLQQPKDTVLEYFKKRGISETTVRRFQVSHKDGSPDVLMFPFFNQTGQLEYLKYRDTKFNKDDKEHCRKEWAEENTRPILFGMNLCNGFDRCIITEGQIDAMSLAEAGLQNVLSVPMGCKNFAWFPWCFEWLTQFKEIVVFGDREKGHITLISELQDRLGAKMPVKCVQSDDYLFEKDANDILCRHGAKWLQRAVDNAVIPSVSAVKPLEAVEIVDLNDLEKIPTGFPTIDKTIGGMVLGTVILLSGKAGDGKSTFMSQLVCSALEEGRKVFAYSGELMPYHFRRWLDSQLATDKYIVPLTNMYGDRYGTLPSEIAQKIGAWYSGRAFIYDNEAELDRNSVLETVERAIRQYGVQLICIDNLMTAMETVKDQDDLYRAQGDFVKRLKEIAKHYSVCIILVAHPKKTNDKGWNNENISGASEVGNYVDVIMSYSRKKDEINRSTLEISKNRITGNLQTGDKAITLNFAPLSKRIYDQSQTSEYDYGWITGEKAEKFVPVADEDIPF